MSSIPHNKPGSTPDHDNTPFIIRNWQFSDLEGRLLTLLESLGLPDKQEDAVKSLIRQAVWRSPMFENRITDQQAERCYSENRPTSNTLTPN